MPRRRLVEGRGDALHERRERRADVPVLAVRLEDGGAQRDELLFQDPRLHLAHLLVAELLGGRAAFRRGALLHGAALDHGCDLVWFRAWFEARADLLPLRVGYATP